MAESYTSEHTGEHIDEVIAAAGQCSAIMNGVDSGTTLDEWIEQQEAQPGDLRDIEVLATEVGYYTNNVVNGVHQIDTSSGNHTPIVAVPKGYDKIMINTRKNRDADTPIAIFYDEDKNEIGVATTGRTTHAYYTTCYFADIPKAAKYVSGGALHAIEEVELFRMWIYSSKSSYSWAARQAWARHSNRIATEETMQPGFFNVGSGVNIGSEPISGTRPTTMDGWAYDILPVELGDEIIVSSHGGSNARAWALLNEQWELVDRAEASADLVANPATVTASVSGYLIINHDTTTTPPADGVFARLKNQKNYVTENELESKLESATQTWNVVEVQPMLKKIIGNSNAISDSNGRLFVTRVSPGEKYRLIVNPGYAGADLRVYKIFGSTDLTTAQTPLERGVTTKGLAVRTEYDIVIPEGAKLLIYQGYYADGSTIGDNRKQKDYPSTGLQLLKAVDIQHYKPRKSLKVLAVGNSFTCDEMSYFPFVLKSAFPDVELRLRILSRSSGSIAQYNDNRDATTIGGVEVHAFDYYDEVGRWSDYYDEATSTWSLSQVSSLAESVALEDWDIIAFQQVSSSPTYESVETPLTELVAWLRQECGFRGKIAWRLTHSYADGQGSFPTGSDDSDSMWALNRDLAKAVMGSGLVDILIPAGTAIQNARHSSLLTSAIPNMFCFGNVSGMQARNIHLTEGIAPFIAAASAVEAIMGNVAHARVRLSAAWLIPGAATPTAGNGDTLEATLTKYGEDVSDKAQALGVRCAMNAITKPYAVTDENGVEVEI